MAQVIYKTKSGKPDRVWEGLVASVSDARRRGRLLLGATSTPSARAEELGEVYAELWVLYKTKTRSDVVDLLRDLIEQFGDDCDNEHKDAPVLGTPPYFLVVAIA